MSEKLVNGGQHGSSRLPQAVKSMPIPSSSGPLGLMPAPLCVEWAHLLEHGTALRLTDSLDRRPLDEGASMSTSAPFGDDASLETAREGSSPSPNPEDSSSDLDTLARRSRIVGELYKSSFHRVFCFARKSVDHDAAEEVAHETFVRLLKVRNLETMQIGVAYLLRIAENLLKRKYERTQRYRVVLQRFGEFSLNRAVEQEACRDQRGLRGQCDQYWVVSRSASAESGVQSHTESQTQVGSRPESALDTERLGALLLQLTQREQAAVRLIVCEGLDYQAAARSLGVPTSTINNWKHRGLSKIKSILTSPTLPRSASDDLRSARSSVGGERRCAAAG